MTANSTSALRMVQPSELITKLAAAERQLCEAILLFFEQRDMVAIHTLTTAALQVLHDIGSTEGVVSLLKGITYVRSEKQKEWRAIMSKAQNFFKHADNDANATLEFYPEATTFYLQDAVAVHKALTEKPFPLGVVFQFWFTKAYPHLLLDEKVNDAFREQLTAAPAASDFAFYLKTARFALAHAA